MFRYIVKATSFFYKLYATKFSKNSFGVNNKFQGVSAIDNTPNIRIGNNNVFCSSSYFTALGVSKKIKFTLCNPEAKIVIGHYNGFSGTTICAAVSVEIGSNCLFGADVMIFDTDFHPICPTNRRFEKSGIMNSPVKIGNNVFLGTQTIVMKGVAIGDNTVIGAGSVVTKSIPKNSIAAGNPCRVIGQVDE